MWPSGIKKEGKGYPEKKEVQTFDRRKDVKGFKTLKEGQEQSSFSVKNCY